jgi:hypothetical protein
MSFVAGAPGVSTVLQAHGGLLIHQAKKTPHCGQGSGAGWTPRQGRQGGEYHLTHSSRKISYPTSQARFTAPYQLSSNLTSSPIRIFYEYGPDS